MAYLKLFEILKLIGADTGPDRSHLGILMMTRRQVLSIREAGLGAVAIGDLSLVVVVTLSEVGIFLQLNVKGSLILLEELLLRGELGALLVEVRGTSVCAYVIMRLGKLLSTAYPLVSMIGCLRKFDTADFVRVYS